MQANRRLILKMYLKIYHVKQESQVSLLKSWQMNRVCGRFLKKLTDQGESLLTITLFLDCA